MADSSGASSYLLPTNESHPLDDSLSSWCPCWNGSTAAAAGGGGDFLSLDRYSYEAHLRLHQHRFLDEDAPPPPPPPPVWETVVVAVTLAVMFGFMMTDRIGPDWVMTAGVVLFMACEIVTIPEGLEGFSNEGILTVMALFVVAEGVSRTGALDYYLGLILGSPKTVAGAQIRLMVPIATLSAFLNNTPIVAVMIPLTTRWAKRIGVPKQQLLIPLSYATILGGTCTLVGTSTNLVVSGLLTKNYPNEPSGNIGLFDIAVYGVPNAMIGLAYMLAFAPFLLPYGKNKTSNDTDDLLLGAVVKPWSPAAGRTIKRSGLGNSGGIFLTNVRRAATGNVHRAVSSDFVISIGDELYFTGSVENFADFCDRHGLEIITNDTRHTRRSHHDDDEGGSGRGAAENGEGGMGEIQTSDVPAGGNGAAAMVMTHPSKGPDDPLERLRQIRQMSDQIAGHAVVETGPRPVQLLVALDETEQTVLVGVDCEDHPGLLMHISDGIGQLGYNLKHSEAKVIGDRSLSVWRCDAMPATAASASANGSGAKAAPAAPDVDELWSSIFDVLKVAERDLVAKKCGSRVVRAYVTKSSNLIGNKPIDVDFRQLFKASIVAYQKKGRNYALDVELNAGDLLVLHTAEESPLLARPPADFYETLEKLNRSSANVPSEPDIEVSLDGYRQAWSDLKVEFDGVEQDASVPKGEFLTAFVVPANSPLLSKSLTTLGYHKLSGVALIGVERPNGAHGMISISPDDVLQEGDLVWYSGGAEAIADLQRVQGLAFYRDDEMKSQAVALTERRLVQAVIAKGSPLVGRTVKDVHFRSEYGGVVIAIQRGSDRVHELPANVQLKTGDVLLVEASRTFVDKHESNYRTFALLSEVENSSPPRPRLFMVCLLMIIASLAVAALEIRSLLITAALVGIVMVALGVVTQQEAREALQWDLYVTVAAAFGIGNAMENSGVAGGLATFLVRVGQSLGIGVAGVYGSVYFAGNLMSAVLTNNAAATLMFPIAMDAVNQTGADRLKMSMILMLSASDYITSFGYQTNLMVYGPGEYANFDFFKFGAPMQILLWLSSTAMVATLSGSDPKFLTSWAICAVGFVVVAAFRLTGSLFFFRKGKKGDENKDVGSFQAGGSWQLASRDAPEPPVEGKPRIAASSLMTGQS